MRTGDQLGADRMSGILLLQTPNAKGEAKVQNLTTFPLCQTKGKGRQRKGEYNLIILLVLFGCYLTAYFYCLCTTGKKITVICFVKKKMD